VSLLLHIIFLARRISLSFLVITILSFFPSCDRHLLVPPFFRPQRSPRSRVDDSQSPLCADAPFSCLSARATSHLPPPLAFQITHFSPSPFSLKTPDWICSGKLPLTSLPFSPSPDGIQPLSPPIRGTFTLLAFLTFALLSDCVSYSLSLPIECFLSYLSLPPLSEGGAHSSGATLPSTMCFIRKRLSLPL